MNIKGQILKINEIEELGQSKFKKRSFFLDRTTKEQFGDREFPNFAEITLLGDKTDLANNLSKGDIVNCYIDVKGRFFTHENVEKFAQDLVCWKIDIVNKVDPNTTASKTENFV